MAAKPLRANRILRWKLGREFRGIEFVADRIEPVGGSRLRMIGKLDEHDVTLFGRIVHQDDESVVITARGRVGRVRIELAGEFTS